MTFILREIRTLRTLGFDIRTASINSPDHRPNQLTAVEREEEAQTYYIKPDGIIGALKAHFYTIFTQPLSYLRGFWFALRLGKWDLKKNLYGCFYFIEAVMVGQWMRREQCSHLHIHLGTSSSTVGLIVKHTFPITFSMTIHGPADFYDIPGYYLIQKILDATFICCISHFTRSQLMAWSPPSCWDKLEVSRLGVDPNQFTPRPFRQQPEPFEILCVGRLVPEKGQFILIQAVTNILAQKRQLRLRIVGDGPERQTLEDEVKKQGLTEQIIFEGAVNQDQILEFYNGADVFVLASFAEGLPIVLMEAMSMEIPCITTNITGIPELMINGKEGLLVPASATKALIEAILLLMDNPKLRDQIGQAGRQRILEHYDLQANVNKLADIFHRRLEMDNELI
ncbi:glycosyl transferase, group 1 family protein [Beggiatoa sp. PS]|nr:glycosyl transferase, group 1 family protein [Beggiatoa sp. PS]